MAHDILIVDDEKDICYLIGDILTDEGYQCRFAHSGEEALSEVQKRRPHLILLDIWLGESRFDGLKVLDLVKTDHCDLPILMMSGHGTIETAVSAIKMGAYDFLEKPFKSDRLIILVHRALETHRLRQENAELKQKTPSQEDIFIGSSPSIQSLNEMVAKVAPTNSRIVIQGPLGSGKEGLARKIHANSKRAGGPFVILNCAGLELKDLEEKLFGRDKENGFNAGVLEQAHHGTLYLDAVDEMTLDIQGKMVKALQSQEFYRMGGKTPVNVDVRVIASTALDLQALVSRKLFREDLYYRLNVVTLTIPTLRERREDMAALVNYFTQALAFQNAVRPLIVTEEALMLLKNYHWPGDVRQLRNVIEGVLLVAQDPQKQEITRDDLPQDILSEAPQYLKDQEALKLMLLPLREAREQFEKEYLLAQVERFEGNISRTAEFIGMERSALHRKLKALQIQK